MHILLVTNPASAVWIREDSDGVPQEDTQRTTCSVRKIIIREDNWVGSVFRSPFVKDCIDQLAATLEDVKSCINEARPALSK